MSNPPRIKSITVKGLFNQFDHHIELNQEERITILHGINGVGKTTILQMIARSFNFGHFYFNLPFSYFEIESTNEKKLIIKKDDRYDFKHFFLNQEKFSFDDLYKKSILKAVPFLKERNGVFYDSHYVDYNEPLSLIDIEKLSLTDVEERYKYYGIPSRESVFKSEFNSKFIYIPIHFIKSSRILSMEYRKKSQTIRDTVKIYASEFRQIIKTAMEDYAKKTQELEQTFPFRVLDVSEYYIGDVLKERIKTLQEKRQELRNIKLLPATDLPLMNSESISKLEKNYSTLMSFYVKDSEEKLKVLEPLGQKIKLFLNIINGKFQGKELRIDENKGFIIIGKDKKEIDLSLLSSGEQHELVMFYDLIFKVEPNTLVMIDEPELSLHITWQNKFIDELKQIVELSKFDVLIATHSSTIIGKNSHLMVRLGVNE